jgi:hypothetical protein
MYTSFLQRVKLLFLTPKYRLLGVHWGREIKYSAGMTGYPMYWFYEIGDQFMISGFFGAVIRGKLPKCLDRVSDSGKIRYLKRYIPKADRR